MLDNQREAIVIATKLPWHVALLWASIAPLWPWPCQEPVAGPSKGRSIPRRGLYFCATAHIDVVQMLGAESPTPERKAFPTRVTRRKPASLSILARL